MNCAIFMRDSSREEVKSFLESNKSKYFTIINTKKDLKWIFDYDKLEYDEEHNLVNLHYKLMYPLSSYPDYTGIFSNDKFSIEPGEVIRLATEEEIKMFNEIYDIWSTPTFEHENQELLEKFNVKSELELKAIIVKKIMDSDNIIETLKEILNK